MAQTGQQPLRALARRPLVRRLRSLASGEPHTADALMLGLALAVGVTTGLLAVALIQLLAAIQAVAFGTPLPSTVTLVVMPVVGALLVGLLATYWLPEVRGGVSGVMASIVLRGGRMRPDLAPGMLLASAVNLGTGSSGGREGPIVQIGGSIGSTVGRLFALSEEQMRALIAAGAGGGIAAAFNAPIAGMLFAFEVILGGFRVRSLQIVVVASVSASVTARQIVGPELIYSPPPYRLGEPIELVLYAGLGLAAVAVGIALNRGEDLVSRLFGRWRTWPPLRLAAGGLAVGLVALAVPEALGSGDHLPPMLGAVQEPIAEMLDGTLGGSGLGAAGFLLLLLVAKLVAVVFALGSGHAVGSFTPAIFLGAALGGAIGHGVEALAPGMSVQPGAVALVGMAAVLGASSRAPLTAILLAFELTGDYGLVLPLMLATGIATFLADRLDRESIYTLPLSRLGVVYSEPEGIDIMQTVQVGEVMTTDPAPVAVDLPLPELDERLRRTRRHGFPVIDGDRLVGIVTVTDLAQATGDAPSPPETLTVGDICTRRVLTVTPEDPVFRALRRMASLDVGRLPVVAPDDHSRLVGVVRRADIVKAYQRAVARSLGVQQRRQSSRLRDLGGTQFVEFTVEAGAPAADAAVRDVSWPQRTILTSVRRGGEVLMPDGDTMLQPGDEVVVLTDRGAADTLQTLFSAAGAGSDS